MSSFIIWIGALAAVSATLAHPMGTSRATSANPHQPIPELSNYYSTYRRKAVPYPGNETDPILPTTNGTTGPDDVWRGSIRAHSPHLVFPTRHVIAYRRFGTIKLDISPYSSHKSQATRSNLDPASTNLASQQPSRSSLFPYANEILDSTNQFIVPGSCPAANPAYPYPNQKPPQFTYNPKTNSSLTSGMEIEFVFTTPPPVWDPEICYHAVFFHGILNISMPFDTKTNLTTIPDFELNRGLIVGVISDTPSAPTLDPVVAGPVLHVERPAGAIKLAQISR